MQKILKMTMLSWISVSCLLGLTGCASIFTSQRPKGSVTMTQAYNQAMDGSTSWPIRSKPSNGNYLKKVLNQLKQQPIHLSSNETQLQKQLNQEFPQTQNPNILMYVYPHCKRRINHILSAD
jgi:conjugative transfer region lipoprotein (TIGR03751 family)